MRLMPLVSTLALATGALAATPVDPARLDLQLRAELAWEQPLATALVSAPIGSESEILLALEGALEARDTSSGDTLWRVESLAGALVDESGLSLREGSRVIGIARGGPEPTLAIIDIASGRILASTTLPAQPGSAPVATQPGSANPSYAWLVALEGGRVLALDAEGKIIARHELGEAISGLPSTLLGFPVAWRGEPARLVTLEGARTGRRVQSPLASAAASAGRWLSAPGEAGALRAWSCRERRHEQLRCRRTWTQRMGGRVLDRPLVSDDRIVAGSLDTYVYAFRPRSGHLLWRTSVGHRIGKGPLAWDDFLAVVGEGRAEIVFLDALDGRIVGRIDGGSASRSETCTTRPERAGPLLVAPILETPGSGPTLKAWRIEFVAPPPPPPPQAPEAPGSEETAAEQASEEP